MIWLHLIAAALALGLGAANLALAKGTRRHRVMGWIWIALMLSVSLSSFAIRDRNDGAFSWIHILSGWVLFCMCMAIFNIRRGNTRGHAGFMVGTMAGAVTAGLYALAPGRFIAGLLGY